MTSPLSIQTAKELRALQPWWLGVAAATAIVGSYATHNGGVPGLRVEQHVWFVVAHAVGSLAIAALAVGHELSHATLPMILAQPIDRRRVLAIKVVVLTAMLGGLGVLAQALFPAALVPPAVLPVRAARTLVAGGRPWWEWAWCRCSRSSRAGRSAAWCSAP